VVRAVLALDLRLVFILDYARTRAAMPNATLSRAYSASV
jgi:hypothetical protein